MTKIRFIHISSWALMSGAVAFFPLIIGIMLNHTLYEPRWLDKFGGILAPVFMLSQIYPAIGMLGLSARYGDQIGDLGWESLKVGAFGGAITTIGFLVPTFINGSDPRFWFGVIFGGSTMLFTGLLLFGILAPLRKPLPRWNGLPLAAGLWFPILILHQSHAIHKLPKNPLLAIALAAGSVVMAVAMMQLGYILKTDVPEDIPAT